MTTKSPTDLARDARTLADSLRERFNAGEFTLHRAATMLDTLAALISEQAATIAALEGEQRLAQDKARIEAAGLDDSPREFKVGDRVRIAHRVATDRAGHPCYWTSGMDQCLGHEGVIDALDWAVWPQIPYGVLALGQRFYYSPEALDLLPPLGEVRRLAGGLVLTDEGTITMPGVEGMEIPPPPVGKEMTQAEQDEFYDAHYPEESK